MPKIKIKEFKGIYSNADENDLRLELFKDSVNFKHEQGYAEYEPSFIEQVNLPVITEDWSWETGIFTTLSNDLLSQNPIPDKWDILFLIAKKYEDNIYSRRFYYKNLSSGSTWIRLSKEGTNDVDISETFYQTTKSGKAFFREDQGILKIFLPHDCFWFGNIKRTLTGIPNIILKESFYLDRLSEPFDKNNLGVWQDRIDPTYSTCYDNRRLGIGCKIDRVDDSGIVLEPEEVEFIPFGENNGLINNGELNPWCQYYQYRIRNKVTGQFYTRPFTYYKFNVGTSAASWLLPGDNTIHIFPVQRVSYNLLIPSIYSSLFKFKDGNGLGFRFGATINKPLTALPTINIQQQATLEFYDPADSFSVTTQALNAYNTTPGYIISQGNSIGEEGFSKDTKATYYIVMTQVLDEKTEIIVGLNTGKYTGAQQKYAIKFSDTYPCKNANKRITRTRFYISFSLEDDFEFAHEINHLDTELLAPQLFYLSELSLNKGIMLSQNIGFTFDWEKKEDYKIVVGFRDFVIENGLSLGLDQNDYIHVYHCAIGGGNIQNDLIYTSNLLPLPDVTNIETLVGTNGNVLAISKEKTFVIKADNLTSVVGYSIIETLEYGVRDFTCVATTGNKTILSTIDGIYLTDGFNITSISKPIDNIVRDNYSTSQIVYNPYMHELYFIPIKNHSNVYFRFRFLEQKWDKRNLTANNSIEFSELFINLTGKIALLSTNTQNLYVEGTLVPSYYDGYLETNNSDLSEPNIDKLINYLEIDFQGRLDTLVYSDGNLLYTFNTDNASVRTTNFLHMPLSLRKAFQKIRLVFQTTTPNTKLYGVEVDFSILKKRR